MVLGPGRLDKFLIIDILFLGTIPIGLKDCVKDHRVIVITAQIRTFLERPRCSDKGAIHRDPIKMHLFCLGLYFKN